MPEKKNIKNKEPSPSDKFFNKFFEAEYPNYDKQDPDMKVSLRSHFDNINNHMSYSLSADDPLMKEMAEAKGQELVNILKPDSTSEMVLSINEDVNELSTNLHKCEMAKDKALAMVKKLKLKPEGIFDALERMKIVIDESKLNEAEKTAFKKIEHLYLDYKKELHDIAKGKEGNGSKGRSHVDRANKSIDSVRTM